MLYQRNWLRIIADINEKPAPWQSPPMQPMPLDLSMSVLRSVSPIHIEYLQQHGRRSLDVGLDLERRQAVGPVRLPPLFAEAHFFRAAHRFRIIRPDVFVDPGGTEREEDVAYESARTKSRSG